jgi:hypothetical protein
MNLVGFSQVIILWDLSLPKRESAISPAVSGVLRCCCHPYGWCLGKIGGFEIIGRADVATGRKMNDRQPIAINKTGRFENGGGVVKNKLNIPTLRKLTR